MEDVSALISPNPRTSSTMRKRYTLLLAVAVGTVAAGSVNGSQPADWRNVATGGVRMPGGTGEYYNQPQAVQLLNRSWLVLFTNVRIAATYAFPTPAPFPVRSRTLLYIVSMLCGCILCRIPPDASSEFMLT